AIVTIPVASVSHRTVTKLLTLRARCLTLVTEGSGCPLAPGPLPSPPRQWRLKEVSFDEARYHVSRNSTPSDSAHASPPAVHTKCASIRCRSVSFWLRQLFERQLRLLHDRVRRAQRRHRF